jgi:hypothetical protein
VNTQTRQTLADGTLPDTVATLLAPLLGADDVYFVPIRHHSPACARALQQLLSDVQPAAILIEGPDDLGHLLPLLQHEQTRAPVALLCQAQRQRQVVDAQDAETETPEESPSPATTPDTLPTTAAEPTYETRNSFFPLCDYSPEWVALRAGAALGVPVAWIDLPWQDKAWDAEDAHPVAQPGSKPHDTARSQMEERYFAHSAYLQAMAKRMGCVDHQDLWDRLFELRTPSDLADWKRFFSDVFCWCAMARQDYEPEVLEAELSLPRERHMAAHIARWRKDVQGPIVVVTGGFHTPELLRSWKTTTARKPTRPTTKKTGDSPKAWLIRYSFERLDALNGYSAGMPSPGYYQQVWDRLQDAPAAGGNPFAAVALDCLIRFAQQTRNQDQLDAVSTALVHAAALQAQRLADLRGNAGPGRQDLLDAMRSCYVKGAMDDGTRGFTADVRTFLGGSRMGDVPPSAGSPPLIEDARRMARTAGVRLDDSSARVAHLDLYRKPSHRQRSRFFHAMAYLDVGLAQWLSGPDFMGNSRLNMLFEEWRAAWSPLVEARLIELATDGASVEAVCLVKLEREEAALAAQGRSRSASAAVMLLLRACLVGLQVRLPQLLAMLTTHLNEDASLASVVDCGHRLITLWRAREPLGVQQHPQLRALLLKIRPAALFLLPNLAQCPPDSQAQAVKTLLSLRELWRLLEALDNDTLFSSDTRLVSPDALTAHLQRLTSTSTTPPAIAGAASALLYLDGVWDEAALGSVVQTSFGVGSQPDEAVSFLSGLMAAAPELLLRVPSLLKSLDELVSTWSSEAFVAYLPELRQAFTGLRPQDTADLASQILHLHGEDSTTELVTMQYETTEADLQAGLQLQAELETCLRRDGLSMWLVANETGDSGANQKSRTVSGHSWRAS